MIIFQILPAAAAGGMVCMNTIYKLCFSSGKQMENEDKRKILFAFSVYCNMPVMGPHLRKCIQAAEISIQQLMVTKQHTFTPLKGIITAADA